ncbi:MAG: aminoacyl-tRNA hydrolase [Nitrospinaceae bacterium]|nr:aminoacyl-tRNA hydrolase [Nitrospinaceae bacterium]NIR56101.1 aminoacyl-tRNA hydrolase [Nitrospinaceae bacterium]NIS86549.1 aminoacyl-tRNA hydrolase [Nitrospinaceae bacterium]NIT83383.1 aminoacyl-tRNA hydrolase [Nitrospinaceae bacterium]NIU45593.1 aminoacyl-tRNA hydrolase [Nitrospinaceae bacterium]
MNLVLGLGNPSPRYETTRHNLGFLVVDSLADKYKIKLDQHQHRALSGRGEIEGHPVVVSKAMTYMNESGSAARALLQALDLSPERMIVVHDDIDLALGKIKVKFQGGNAGHGGVGSIIDRLETGRFARVRAGVGRPEENSDVVDYVLSPFPDEEIPAVNEMLDKAVRRIEEILKEMNTQINHTEEQPE